MCCESSRRRFLDKCNWKEAKNHERAGEGVAESQRDFCDESSASLRACTVHIIRVRGFDKDVGIDDDDDPIPQTPTQAIIREQRTNTPDDSTMTVIFSAWNNIISITPRRLQCQKMPGLRGRRRAQGLVPCVGRFDMCAHDPHHVFQLYLRLLMSDLQYQLSGTECRPLKQTNAYDESTQSAGVSPRIYLEVAD